MPKVAYRDDRNDDGRNKRDSDEVEIGRLSVEQFHRILQLARHYAAENKGQSKENQRLLRENEYLKGWLTSYDLAVQRARLQDVLKQIYEKKQMEVSCFMDLVIYKVPGTIYKIKTKYVLNKVSMFYIFKVITFYKIL